MKYVKMLGLLAVAAAALMAFAGTASATLTSPTGTTLGTSSKIHAVNEPNTHVALDPASLPAIECESTVEGSPNASGSTVGNITKLTFEPCTNDWHVTTITAGELEIEGDGKAGTYNGTVYSKGATVEATRFGVSCRYATTVTTKVGSFTGGNPGTMHIEANIPFHSGSFFCGSGSSAWRGDYVTTASLYVDG